MKADGTFKLINGLEIKKDTISQKNYNGTWKLAKRIEKRHRNQFEIRLRVKNGFGGMPSRIPIYKSKNKYELFMFIGDPDMAEGIGL